MAWPSLHSVQFFLCAAAFSAVVALSARNASKFPRVCVCVCLTTAAVRNCNVSNFQATNADRPNWSRTNWQTNVLHSRRRCFVWRPLDSFKAKQVGKVAEKVHDDARHDKRLWSVALRPLLSIFIQFGAGVCEWRVSDVRAAYFGIHGGSFFIVPARQPTNRNRIYTHSPAVELDSVRIPYRLATSSKKTEISAHFFRFFVVVVGVVVWCGGACVSLVSGCVCVLFAFSGIDFLFSSVSSATAFCGYDCTDWFDIRPILSG